jgi:hypothetical protein
MPNKKGHLNQPLGDTKGTGHQENQKGQKLFATDEWDTWDGQQRHRQRPKNDNSEVFLSRG